jgi:hypothetical protein
VPSEIRFTIPKTVLFKNDAAILNIIAANKWERPIYFTSEYRDLGFGDYIRQDGLTYRLVPVSNNTQLNNDWVADKMMTKFAFGNADVRGVYFDEENRRHLNGIRLAYAKAAGNLAENGRKEDAIKLLRKCDKGMLTENMPYGLVSRYQQHNYISLQFLDACYKAGEMDLASKVFKAVKKDLEQQIVYYNELNDDRREYFRSDYQQAAEFLKAMDQLDKMYRSPKASELPLEMINNQPASDSAPKR